MVESRASTLSPRSRALLERTLAESVRNDRNVWGPMRCVDGYFLAPLALGNIGRARELFGETVDMIDQNIAGEQANPENRWHLANFALQPMLHAYARNGPASPDPVDLAWEELPRVLSLLTQHSGDMTENHNLLGLTTRHLAARFFPKLILADGRPVARAAEAERASIAHWIRDHFTAGSEEWGSDIYVGVDIMALMNLAQLSPDPDLAAAARANLDLLAIDQALDAFAGAPVGAARRTYGIYRMDAFESPSRPLHWVWFGTGGERWWNPNFIGAALMAATHDYTPPELARRLVEEAVPHATVGWHRVGLFDSGEHPRTADDPPLATSVGRYTRRGKHHLMGLLLSAPGRARYTEQVLQITLGEQAVLFAGHPSAGVRSGSALDEVLIPVPPPELAERYEVGELPPRSHNRIDAPAFWQYGSMPPGLLGDFRPGWWQGNVEGPRSYGEADWAALLWRLREDVEVPFAHLHLWRPAFDEIVEHGEWIAARKGHGAFALYLPTGYEWTTRGTWKDRELKLPGPQVAVLAMAADLCDGTQLGDFLASCQQRQVTYETSDHELAVGEVVVAWANDPTRGGTPIPQSGPRLQTPWGQLDGEDPDIRLEYQGTVWHSHLEAALSRLV